MLSLHPYEFIPAPAATRTLLLLHGTGGNEHSLLDLGRSLDPGANLLSPRGNVLENGMPRFFRRIAEGVFDEEDVRRRARDLSAWLLAARERHGISNITAVGYSNGANIAAAVMLLGLPGIDEGVLIRGMAPFAKSPGVPASGRSARVLLLSGSADPITPTSSANTLAEHLRASGAQVRHEWLAAGHNLVRDDLTIARAWLEAR